MQHNLKLPISEGYHESDWLVLDENKTATDYINEWPNWQQNAAIIVGDAGVGKTHLANIWLEKSGAEAVKETDDVAVKETDDVAHNKIIMVDDADDWADETKILHLYNNAREQGGFMLLTAKTAPVNWVKLPDLQSRLNSITHLNLGVPSDQMIYMLFHKAFIARQLRVKNDVVDYMVKRVGRCPKAVEDLVEKIDGYSLSQKRAITIPFVKNILS